MKLSAFVVVIVVELCVLRGDICIGFTVTDWTPIIVDNHDMIMSSVLVLLLAKRHQVVGRLLINK